MPQKPETLVWSATVRIESGPQLALSGALPVEAYEKFKITLPDTKTTKVSLAPKAGDVQCLVIRPATTSDKLTYAVGGADIPLDAAVLLVGGAVALAGGPKELSFKNLTGADVDIEILVGRDATP